MLAGRANRGADGVERDVNVEVGEFVVLHGPAAVGEFERPGDQPGTLQPFQMQVEQRSRQPEAARQLTDVHAPAGQRVDHPQPLRVAHGAEQREQLVRGRRVVVLAVQGFPLHLSDQADI